MANSATAPISLAPVERSSTEYANRLYIPINEEFTPGRRQSEPPDYYSVGTNGLAFVPRRGIGDAAILTTKSALMRYAQGTPLRLLAILPDVHPAFGLALWNALRLSAPPDGMRIVAINPVPATGQKSLGAAANPTDDGESEDSRDVPAGGKPAAAPLVKNRKDEGEIDEAGTALLEAFFKSQPPELGGLHGLQTTLTIGAMLTGLPFLEAVPAASGKGLRRVFPVPSLTIRFNREGDDGEAVPYQLQRYPRVQTKGQISNGGGYVKLDASRMFWRAIDNDPDDPYGRVPFGPALPEILRDLAIISDLTDAMHFTAYPRPAFGFDFAETYKIAKEVFGIVDKTEAQRWVMQQFNLFKGEVNKLKPDQAVFFDKNGTFQIAEGSKGLTALQSILVHLRQRVTMSVKSLPTLLGIGDGGTQTRNTVEWQIYAQGLETIRHIIAEIIVGAANLHLQLLGLPLLAKAIYEPIRTVEAMMEATTEGVKIKNEAMKVALGWQTNDQASNEITGSDAVAEPNYAAAGIGVNAGAVPGDDDSSSLGTNSGTTKDETDASKGGKGAQGDQ